jgi:ParB-like chromosome segregation protein Spo0J
VIHQAIEHLAVEIDTLKAHPRNVRQGDVGAISESLREHGQYRPIIVQKSTRYIIAGNHTYKAAKSLGWEKIAAHLLDVDDDTAIRMMLIDNRANDLAMYDDRELANLLSDLATSENGLLGTGYSADLLDDLIKDIETPLTDEFEKVDVDLATEHRCPKCGYEWSGKST